MRYITIFKQGNSLALVIPAPMAKEMNLTRGLTMIVTAPDKETVTFKRLTPANLKAAQPTEHKKGIRYYANARTARTIR